MVTSATITMDSIDGMDDSMELFSSLDGVFSSPAGRSRVKNALDKASTLVATTMAAGKLVAMLGGDPMISSAHAEEPRAGYVQVAQLSGSQVAMSDGLKWGAQGVIEKNLNSGMESLASLIRGRWFSPESTKNILALSSFAQDQEIKGGFKFSEVVWITSLNPVSSNGKGLEQLVNGGDKLPKRTFREVTGQDELTPGNYTAVVKALFDTSDIESWLRNSDGSPLSPKELQDYRDSMRDYEASWSKKYAEFFAAGKIDVIGRWFELFNALAKGAIHGSREEFRRGLQAAQAMANFPTITDTKKPALAPAIASAAAEYDLMLNRGSRVIKITSRSVTDDGKVTILKYSVASDEDLTKLGFSEWHIVNALRLERLLANQRQAYSEEKEIAHYEQKARENKQKAQENFDALIHEAKTLSDQSFELSGRVLKQFEQLKDRRGDPMFIKQLSENIRQIKWLRERIIAFTKKDPDGEYLLKSYREKSVRLMGMFLLGAEMWWFG